MSDIHLLKINITINLIKILSMWGASILIVFRMGVIYADVKTRVVKYDQAVCDVDTLKVWKQKVEAYYYPAHKTMN